MSDEKSYAVRDEIVARLEQFMDEVGDVGNANDGENLWKVLSEKRSHLRFQQPDQFQLHIIVIIRISKQITRPFVSLKLL